MKFRSAALVVCLLLFFKTSISQTVSKTDTLNINDEIFSKVEKEASFPGGDAGWKQYLQTSLSGFNPADNGAPIGYYTVTALFLVDKDGNVTNIKPLTHEGYGMEQEVVRILLKSGKWEPAVQDGQYVKAYRKQPVTFVVQEEGVDFISKRPFFLYANTVNELTIHVDKIKNENLMATITKGSIVPTGDGKFKVRVNTPGQRVVISVFNAKKNNKLISAASFTVDSLSAMPKQVP